MPSPNLTEVRVVPSQLRVAGADTDGPFIRDEILSARDNKRLRTPRGGGPTAGGEVGVFTQIAAPSTGNQTHDERLIPMDEQWPSRHE